MLSLLQTFRDEGSFELIIELRLGACVRGLVSPIFHLSVVRHQPVALTTDPFMQNIVMRRETNVALETLWCAQAHTQ